MNEGLYHIIIDGKPACQRGRDPTGLLLRAHELHLPLVCSGPLSLVAPLVTLFKEYSGKEVEMVPGGCPKYER